MTTAEQILRKHVKVGWIISGDSGNAILAAMEEYRNYQSKPLQPKNEHWHPVQFGFRPLFYLLNLSRDEHGRLSSIAVEKATEEQFEGICFKEDNTGWSLNPIKIGRGFISRSKFDFTEDFQEAEQHAAIPKN